MNAPLSVQIQRWCLFIMLVLLPFSTWYIVQTPFAISPINVYSILFIGIGLFNLLYLKLRWMAITDRKTVYVIGALLLALAYALLFTHPLRAGVGFWISRLLQPLLVGLFAYQLAANKYLEAEEVVTALFYSLLPLALAGAGQLLHLLPMRDPIRITGPYRWPDTYGRYMEILTLLTFPWVFLRDRVVIWRVIAWLFSAAVMVASISYNVVASFAIALAVMILLLPKRFRKWQYALAILSAVLVLLAIPLRHHLLGWHYGIVMSQRTRIEFWVVAEAVIKRHFWTGIGIKGWELQFPQLVQMYGPYQPSISAGSEQPQNVFLDSFLKAGLPGFLAITTLLIWPIRRGYQLFRAQKLSGTGWFGLGVLGYGVGMFLFGILDDPLWSDETVPLLFILLFLVAFLHQDKERLASLKNLKS